MNLLAVLLCLAVLCSGVTDVPTTKLYPSNAIYSTGDEANLFINRMESTVPSATDDARIQVYEQLTGIGPGGYADILSGSFSQSFTNGPWNNFAGSTTIPSFGWVTTTQPSGNVGSYPYIANGWRSHRLTGSFGNGVWKLNMRLHNILGTWSGATFQGYIYARVYKANYDGSHAVELNSRLVASQVFNIIDSSTADAEITFALNKAGPNAQVFNGEYLFLQVALRVQAWSVTGSSVGNYYVSIDYGASTVLTAPPFNGFHGSEEICSSVYKYREEYVYIAPDGVVYPLDVDGRRIVLTDENTGMADIDYNTQQGPRQHGETVNGFTLKPRVVQLLIRHDFPSRDGYWNGRENILSMLSPARQLVDGNLEAGILRKLLSTGAQRDLKVRISEGPGFKPHSLTNWDEWAYQEVIRFIAHDPVYFDPIQHSYTFDRQGSQLTFPITFPITFTTIDQIATIYYGGTWLAYPQFVINGPCTMVHIHNFTTDEMILVDYPLLLGESITITLEYGSKTIVKSDGTNLLGYLSDDSDIGTFHLTENNGGANQIRVFAHGVQGNSQIAMYWYPRYLGV